MKAKDLIKGCQYRDGKGTVQITILMDATPDGTTAAGEPQVVAAVRFRDGGSGLRWFDAEDEVPYTLPEKEN